MTFGWAPLIERLQHPVRLFDAMGLALFAVVGAQKALDFGVAPPMAAGLGMLTGIGGGIVRDVLLAQVPLVLRADLYAVAALAGAAWSRSGTGCTGLRLRVRLPAHCSASVCGSWRCASAGTCRSPCSPVAAARRPMRRAEHPGRTPPTRLR